jgi:hypothetical protein
VRLLRLLVLRDTRCVRQQRACVSCTCALARSILPC